MDAAAQAMCEIGRRAYTRQLIAGTEGNFSCRLADGRILCTPTGLCKGRLTADDLCITDRDGHQCDGRHPCSSEILLHTGVYRAAPGVRAIVHTHPPYATTFAVLGGVDLRGVLPEGDILLGSVPLVPYRTPGTAEMATALAPFLAEHCAALLESHGAVTWGADLETAYCLTETLEALCRVVFQARQLGTVRLIPPEQRAALAAIRARLRG
jgi:L-fuculose-phosphate aldolase